MAGYTQDAQTQGELSAPGGNTVRSEVVQRPGLGSQSKGNTARSELVQPAGISTTQKVPLGRSGRSQFGGIGNGLVVPGAFRRVTVWLEDANGEPLTEAIWCQSAGKFPTAGKVETAPDGRAYAELWLLSVTYSAFQVLAESEESEAYGYVWYEAGDGTGEVAPTQTEATLQFDPEKAQLGGGMVAGSGINIG
jgi:hypothetical protein